MNTGLLGSLTSSTLESLRVSFSRYAKIVQCKQSRSLDRTWIFVSRNYCSRKHHFKSVERCERIRHIDSSAVDRELWRCQRMKDISFAGRWSILSSVSSHAWIKVTNLSLCAFTVRRLRFGSSTYCSSHCNSFRFHKSVLRIGIYLKNNHSCIYRVFPK